jgi:hypothetical protein
VRRSLYCLVAAALVPAALFASGASATGARHASGAAGLRHVFVPAHPNQVLPLHNADTSSLNWAGYAVTGSNITRVTSTYSVPKTKLAPPGFTANWTGIGGYTTTDLIQAGTAEQTVGGYYAWYEILPAPETRLTNCTGDAACTVAPGDVMSIDISNAGGDQWTVSLSDGSKWSWNQTITYQSSESSAEWILEAPTVGVQTIPANIGTSHFGPTSRFTSGGVSRTIAGGHPVSISMGLGLVNLAIPSGLASNGQGFNVCTYKLKCPTPPN